MLVQVAEYAKLSVIFRAMNFKFARIPKLALQECRVASICTVWFAMQSVAAGCSDIEATLLHVYVLG